MQIHLGVTDIAYSDGEKTTGEVAEILEKKYHVLELFFEEVGGDAVAKALEHSAQTALEDLISGVPNAEDLSLTLQATEEVQDAFRHFLDQRELDGVEPGVPTKAAQKGVRHRFKHATAKGNSERPSFIDTGTYQASMRTWTT